MPSGTRRRAEPPAAGRPTPAAIRDNKRSHNKQANRTAIIEAARACFLDLGYDAVTVRDIVRASALAPGTFYNYFADKEALFREILEQRINELNEGMRTVRISAPNLEAFVYGSFHALFGKIVEDPSFFRLVLRNEHAVRTLFSETVIGIPMRSLAEDLHAAIKRKLLPEQLDVELLAASFFGIGFEIGRVLSQREAADAEAAARFANTLVLEGVQAFGMNGLMALIRRKLV
ncbi:MAG: TetR/AcrR family transcriptional regulator [Nevskia sp.]